MDPLRNAKRRASARSPRGLCQTLLSSPRGGGSRSSNGQGFFSLLYRYELRQDARSSILGSGNLVGDSRYTTSHSPALKPPPLRRETYLQDRTSKQCIVPWPNWETMMECPLICRSWAQLTSQLDPPFQHPGHAYAQARSARFRSIQPNTP